MFVSILWMLGCGGAPVATSLADAPAAKGSALTVDDGAADLGALAAYDRTCDNAMPVTNNRGGSPCVEHHFYVAPIRSGGAASGEVRAWVTCPSAIKEVDACKAWLGERPQPSGRVLWRFDADADTGWAKAIAASGLASADRAPVLIPE